MFFSTYLSQFFTILGHLGVFSDCKSLFEPVCEVFLLIYDRFYSCLTVFIWTHKSFLLSTIIPFSFCVGWSVVTIFCSSSILNSCFCTHLVYPSLICIAEICWKRGALELWELWNLDWIADRLHATCWKGCECTRARCKCLWQAVKICHVRTG